MSNATQASHKLEDMHSATQTLNNRIGDLQHSEAGAGASTGQAASREAATEEELEPEAPTGQAAAGGTATATAGTATATAGWALIGTGGAATSTGGAATSTGGAATGGAQAGLPQAGVPQDTGVADDTATLA